MGRGRGRREGSGRGRREGRGRGGERARGKGRREWRGKGEERGRRGRREERGRGRREGGGKGTETMSKASEFAYSVYGLLLLSALMVHDLTIVSGTLSATRNLSTLPSSSDRASQWPLLNLGGDGGQIEDV